MRRIFILCISLAMSALAFNNCAYPEWEPEPSTDADGGYNTVTPVLPAVTDFSIVASIAQTKSELSETGELIWNDGDLINVFHNVAGEANLVSDGVVYYDSRDEQENVFKGKLGKKLKEGYAYDWYVFYPYTADLSIVDNAAPITIGSPAAGSQTQNGYDNPSHISGKYMPMYGTATGVDADETPVTELAHLASVIELNITSCMTTPTKLTEIKLTAAEEIVGSFVIDLVKGSMTPVQSMTSKTAVLNVENAAFLANGESAKFYLTVRPFVATVKGGLRLSVNGLEKPLNINSDIEFAAGKITTIDYTYYDIDKVEDSLLGCFRIKKFWLYGGTGPAHKGAGWLDLHDKPYWFDETSGHGIRAEQDNYIEFTLVDLIEGGKKAVGKCVNWAGVDGKNWSCWFHHEKINDGQPTDGNAFYRQIPMGESTWVRDYTVTPNTVTFTDKYGGETVLEILEPNYTFVPGYGDILAEANTRVFPRNVDGEHDDLTFHAKLTGWKEVWPARYNELDKVFDCPRDFFIDVDRVDFVPEDAKTYEEPYDPNGPKDPALETLNGAYKIKKFWVYGGTGPEYGGAGWVDLHNKTWWFDQTTGHGIKAELDNYVEFNCIGYTDKNTKAHGTCTHWAGADGKYWDTWFYNNKKSDGSDMNPDAPRDASSFYRQIPIGESTWVRDYTTGLVTFTDASGRKTSLQVHDPGYTFTPGYNDSNAVNNKRTFPRNVDGEHDDLTFHATVTGVDNWTDGIIYKEIDKIFYNPRDFFIDMDKVDSVPEESKKTESKYTPEF